MELLESLLGINEGDRGIDNIFELIGGLSRWILGCGCLLILGFIALVGALAVSVDAYGDDVMGIVVVVVMGIVATVSLIRTSRA